MKENEFLLTDLLVLMVRKRKVLLKVLVLSIVFCISILSIRNKDVVFSKYMSEKTIQFLQVDEEHTIQSILNRVKNLVNSSEMEARVIEISDDHERAQKYGLGQIEATLNGENGILLRQITKDPQWSDRVLNAWILALKEQVNLLRNRNQSLTLGFYMASREQAHSLRDFLKNQAKEKVKEIMFKRFAESIHDNDYTHEVYVDDTDVTVRINISKSTLPLNHLELAWFFTARLYVENHLYIRIITDRRGILLSQFVSWIDSDAASIIDRKMSFNKNSAVEFNFNPEIVEVFPRVIVRVDLSNYESREQAIEGWEDCIKLYWNQVELSDLLRRMDNLCFLIEIYEENKEVLKEDRSLQRLERDHQYPSLIEQVQIYRKDYEPLLHEIYNKALDYNNASVDPLSIAKEIIGPFNQVKEIMPDEIIEQFGNIKVRINNFTVTEILPVFVRFYSQRVNNNKEEFITDPRDITITHRVFHRNNIVRGIKYGIALSVIISGILMSLWKREEYKEKNLNKEK